MWFLKKGLNDARQHPRLGPRAKRRQIIARPCRVVLHDEELAIQDKASHLPNLLLRSIVPVSLRS